MAGSDQGGSKRARVPRRQEIALAVALVAGSVACDPGVRLGVPCELASDCAAPLACVLGRCREACREAADCDAPAECLRTPEGIQACSIVERDVCEDVCGAPLVCVAGRCRQSCEATACAPGMSCGAELVCARSDATPGDAGAADASSDASAGDAGTGDAGACSEPCDPVRQCGCGAGMRCGVVAGALGCLAAGGTAVVGAACDAEGDCAPGTGCHGGRCLEYCDDASDCDAADVYCGTTSASGASPPAGVRLCSEACDPTTQTGCVAGACSVAILAEPVGASSWCRDVGSSAAGEACEADLECAAGTICELSPARGTGRYCLPFCALGGAPCAAGTCTEIHRIRGAPIAVCLP